ITPGDYEIVVKIKDSAGRKSEKIENAKIKQKDKKELFPEENKSEWEFDLNQILKSESSVLEIRYKSLGEEDSAVSRPLYIYFKDKNDSILKIFDINLNLKDVHRISLDPNLKGLFYIEAARIGIDGSFQKTEKPIMIKSLNNRIELKIDCPSEAEPGDYIPLDLQIKSEHKNKKIEIGCVLVDAASRAVSGKDSIRPPFQNSEETEKKDNKLTRANSWNAEHERFLRRIDDFLEELFSYKNKNPTSSTSLSDILRLIDFIDKSGLLFKEFVEFHLQNLYYLLTQAEFKEILELLKGMIRHEFKNNLDIDKLTSFINYRRDIIDISSQLLTHIPDDLSKTHQNKFDKIRGSIINLIVINLFKELAINQDKNDFLFHYLGISKTLDDFWEVLSQWIEKMDSIGVDTTQIRQLEEELKINIEESKEIEIEKYGLQGIFSNKQKGVIISMDSKFVRGGFVGEERPDCVFSCVVGYPKYTSIMTDVEHYTGGMRVEKERERQSTGEETEQKISVRSFFAHTGYWNPNIQINDGRKKLDLKLPDSITQQDFYAFASSEECDLGYAVKSIHVRQEFFLQPDLPASFTYGDTVTIGAILTNRSNFVLESEVSLNTEGMKINDTPKRQICLEANTFKKVQWEVFTNQTGEIELKFDAVSLKYRDIVSKVVYVHPNGEPEQKITQGTLEPGLNQWKIHLDPKEIAHYAFFSVIPDELHGALDGLEAMMKYPYGCVEQTMGCVLPNLLVYDYLKTHDKLTDRFKKLTEEYTIKGLQRLLMFRHRDRGWGWWEADETSVFMTSYVLRGLTKMNELGFYVSKNIIEETIELIFGCQKEDGSWATEIGLKWDKISNSTGLQPCVITIYIIQRLIDTNINPSDNRIQKALNFVQRNLNVLKNDPNGLSRAYLLLNSINPNNPNLANLLENLLSLHTNGLWPNGSALGGQIESSALAIRALYRANAEKYKFQINNTIGKIVRKRSAKGGWKTTSDTSAVVETFLELQKGESPLSSFIIELNDLKKELSITNDNLDIAFVNMRNIPLYKVLKPGENVLSANLKKGKNLFYQLSELIWTKQEQKQENYFLIERTHSTQICKIGDIVRINISIKAITDKTKLIVIEERIPSGFALDRELIQKDLSEHKNLDNFDILSNRIVLFPKDAKEFKISYSMIAIRPFKGIHPSTVLFAMYEPDIRAGSSSIEIEITSKLILKYKNLITHLISSNEISFEMLQEFLELSEENSLKLLKTLKDYIVYSKKADILKFSIDNPEILLENTLDIVASWQRAEGV
ncbi:MAG: hypothetical protein GF383_11390, partial [Candidatus Lokiarchaeota archaeon]|nr:hypothetical protein [Candidatus Lokiarchaeota archaeon]MBD3341327.1 hypothetical protein [Candidatus Lokiarchaeota archaeon]